LVITTKSTKVIEVTTWAGWTVLVFVGFIWVNNRSYKQQQLVITTKSTKHLCLHWSHISICRFLYELTTVAINSNSWYYQ